MKKTGQILADLVTHGQTAVIAKRWPWWPW